MSENQITALDETMIRETRRQFLGALASCCFCGSAFCTPEQRDTRGCSVSEDELKRARIMSLGDSDLTFSRRSTGDHNLDLALDAAIKQLADTFSANPGFGFYDDDDWPNAMASPAKLLPNTTGTVLFGERYFKKWMAFDPTGITVLVIIAHEFGHILQYQSNRYSEIQGGLKTSKRIELHADFMSGVYVGILRKQNPTAPFWRAGDQIRQIGSYDYTNPGFHGTPEERVAASQAGFTKSFLEGLDVAAAFNAGVNYVSTL